MSEQGVKHGTSSGYIHYGCRCDVCREGQRVRCLNYRKQKAYGKIPDMFVDAGPVRVHVWALRNSGMTIKEIAMLSGVGMSSIKMLTNGRPKSVREHRTGVLPKEVRRFSKVNAERLLVLTPKELEVN